MTQALTGFNCNGCDVVVPGGQAAWIFKDPNVGRDEGLMLFHDEGCLRIYLEAHYCTNRAPGTDAWCLMPKDHRTPCRR